MTTTTCLATLSVSCPSFSKIPFDSSGPSILRPPRLALCPTSGQWPCLKGVGM